MARTHRTLDGHWAACAAETCPLLYHIDLTVAEAETLPEQIFQQLAGAIDPPQEDDGMKYWQDEDGNPHRDYDLPAKISPTGSQEWYHHGQRHRDGDKPAITYHYGRLEWYRHGQRHRDNGPAIVYASGIAFWYREGKRYQANGEPMPPMKIGIYSPSPPADEDSAADQPTETQPWWRRVLRPAP